MTSSGRKAGALQGLILVLPCTTAVMGSAILAPNIPQMIGVFGQSIDGAEFWVPAMVTLPALCIALFSTVAGAVADMIGRRRMMIIAMALYGLAGMLPLVVQDFWIIFASRVVVGLMEAIILCSSTVLIGDYFSGARRDHWLAMQTTTASISAAIMFPLGGYVGQFGWQYPFAMYGYSLILLIPLILLTWEPEESEELEKHEHPWGSIAGIGVAAALVTYGVSRFAGWLTPLVIYALVLVAMVGYGLSVREKASHESVGEGSWATFPWLPATGIYLVTAIAAIMFYLLQILMANVLAEAGITNTFEAGIIIAVVSLGIPFGTIIFARIKQTPVSYLILLTFSVIAIGFWGMAKAPDVRTLLIFSFINQTGCGLALPTMLTWSMRQFDFSHRGRGIGLFQSFMNGGQFVGPTFVTWLAALLTAGAIKPSYEYVAYGAAVVAIGAIIAILLKKGTQRPEYESPPSTDAGLH